MKFERTYKVGVRDIGLNNYLTNVGLLGFLEDVACTHSSTLGYGINNINRVNGVWILMDWKLHVIERPKYEDELTIKTWARPFLKPRFYTYRDFQVFDKNNKLVAIASSKWVFFDMLKNKITKLDEDMLSIYSPVSESVFEEDEMEKITSFNNLQKSDFTYTVRRSDIDINMHMHNLNYLSLAYEALPECVYMKPEMPNIRITYKHQIKLGDTVKCYYNYANGNHTVEIRSIDGKTLHATIQIS